MQKHVPFDGFHAYYRKVDNTVHLSSTNPLLKDLDFVVPRNSVAEQNILTVFRKEGILEKNIEDIVDSFITSEMDYAAYGSGLIFDTSMNSKNKPFFLEVLSATINDRNLFVGLDMREVALLYLDGDRGYGKTTFIRKVLPSNMTSVVDFTRVDFKALLPSARKSYGDSLVYSFLNDKNSRYFVVENFTGVYNLSQHPALYHDMFQQIIESKPLFKNFGKTLVISGGEKERLADHPPDKTIVFEGVENQYRFDFNNVKFPPIGTNINIH